MTMYELGWSMNKDEAWIRMNYEERMDYEDMNKDEGSSNSYTCHVYVMLFDISIRYWMWDVFIYKSGSTLLVWAFEDDDNSSTVHLFKFYLY